MKTIRSAMRSGWAGVVLGLGLWAGAQMALAAPTQWTALYNREQPAATYVVGDMLDYQFEFAINMDTSGWGAEYGLGKTQDGTDWSWYGADWSRMDGDDNRVWISSQYRHQFTSAGTWYYAGRFLSWYPPYDMYYAATDWTANSGEPLAAESYFTVNELSIPSFVNAWPDVEYPATRAQLGWQQAEGKNVLVTMATEPPTGSPEPGVEYEPNDMFGNQTVMGSRLAFNGLDVPGLMPGQTYYFTFYAENMAYYSEGWTESCTMGNPQVRNTDGGGVEAPQEIFLGDHNLTFGCDAWGTLEGNWGRARMWASLMPSPSEYDFGEWSDFTSAEHKTGVSPPLAFNTVGTWNWGIQIDYGSPYGDNFWYVQDTGYWTDFMMYAGSQLMLTVRPLNNPTNQAATSSGADPAHEIELTWSQDPQGHDVMVLCKPVAGSWIDMEYMQGAPMEEGLTIGDFTVVYKGPDTFAIARDLDAGTTYDFRFCSVNNGYYYSSGVEVRASTLGGPVPPTISLSSPVTGDFSMNEGTSRLFEIWAAGSNLTYSWTWDGESVGGNESMYTHAAAWGDSGMHTLRCSISDNLWTNAAASEWNVTIADLPLEITTSSMPPGMVGVPYNAGLAATNGVVPYEWSSHVPVVAWGRDVEGQAKVPADLPDVVAIGGGVNHSLAVKSDGTVAAWGLNANHQCDVPAGLTNAVAVAGGWYHSVALKSDGTVVAWGDTRYGQCDVPAGLTGVVEIAGSYFNNTALKSDGTVVGWPSGARAGLSNVVAIAGGAFHTVALRSNGTVVAWGEDTEYQCDPPVGLTGVVAVAAGGYYSMALKSDGTIVTWGRQEWGERDVPPGLTGVVAIAAGFVHGLALKSDGTVVAWGNQAYVPAGLSNVVKIWAGRDHDLALRSIPPTLPEGLSCSASGVVSGTPTQAGTNRVTFVVRDSVGTTTNKELEIVIQPAPAMPVFSKTNINVRENGEGRFFVRLDREPAGSVLVNVGRSAGDAGIAVKSGAVRSFKPSNWSTWQAVTLSAPDDTNAVGETATLRISATGVADQFVSATTLDDDLAENLALAAVGSTISGGSQAAQMIDGLHVASTNYGYTTWTSVPPGKVVLDLKQAIRVSRIRLLNWDWIYRVHRYTIESSLDGASWTTVADASSSDRQGWDDWAVADVAARYLRVTGLSNSANAYVVFSELEVYGSRVPLRQLEVSAASVSVREDGQGRFFVRLASAPTGNVVVAVSRSAGDASITVSGGASRSFTALNWSTWQAVTLAQAADGNAASESATIQASASGYDPAFVAAATLDDDIAENVALSSGGATIRGWKAGLMAQVIDGIHATSANYGYTIWTNVPPGTMTLDMGAAMTVSRVRLLNWNWNYRVQRYQIEASTDGASWTTLADASGSDRQGWDDWAVADQAIRYLRFTGLSNSANSTVVVSELEVYGTRPLGRRALLAAAEESVPVSVVTSDDGAPVYESGWAAVDGNPETAWIGQQAGGGNIAVEYGPTLELSGLAVDLAEGSLAAVQYLYSLDAKEWQPLPEDLEANPVSLNFLWLLFPDDGTDGRPAVVEIRPNP